MREEDKAAFVEEYLELCRKYGMCVCEMWGATDYLDICEFDDLYEQDIKELVE